MVTFQHGKGAAWEAVAWEMSDLPGKACRIGKKSLDVGSPQEAIAVFRSLLILFTLYSGSWSSLA